MAREAQARQSFLEEYHANRPAIERLMPGGQEVGERLPGVGRDIRTLPTEQFNAFTKFVLRDADPINFSTYPGRAFRLSDGSVVGLRYSRESGETFEVLISANHFIRRGYKVHQQ